MTTQQLREKLSDEFGLAPWPKAYDVDHETYANVVNDIIKWNLDKHLYILVPGSHKELTFFHVGMNGGIMFKNVELILK